MLAKIIIVIFLVLILYCLGSGLYFLVMEKTEEDSDRVAKALTWRITLSIILFISLFVAYWLGLITPHSIGR